MRVIMSPFPDSESVTDGIGQVVVNLSRELRRIGVEFVKDSKDADLRVAHAGATGTDVDVAHCHGLYWTAEYEAGDAEYATNAIVLQSLRAAREVIVPSAWVAEALARDMHLTATVVPHGVNVEEWQPSLKHDGYTLWNKNRTTDACSPAAVTYLAQHDHNGQYVTTFAETEATDLRNVRVTGRVPFSQMRGLIRAAEVYLSTAKETFGIGILEAMASGVPVVGYGWGSISELVVDGETGVLVEPGDVAGLLDAIKYVRKRRPAMSAAAVERARQFTWQDAARRTLQVYERAVVPGNGRVTVVIPCFNYSKVVGRAIRSVALQSYKNLECIVVDDGSSDPGAVEAAFKASTRGDKRFRLVRQNNAGVANARNRGIAEGAGEFCCCLDADDMMDTDFLKVTVAALRKDPTLGVAFTKLDARRPDGSGGTSGWPDGMDYEKQLRGKNQVPTCATFLRKIWVRLGGYRQRYAPKGAGAEDAEFWLRVGAIGYNMRQVSDQPLFIYSSGTGRVSGDPNYVEPDWTGWHPWTVDGVHPVASIAKPEGKSHPARSYDDPVVSVVVPVGPAHAATVVDAIDSVEAQTFRSWELVVVNDTGKPLDMRAYPFARVVDTPGSIGAGRARNLGTGAARAKLVAYLDADDILQPKFLAETLKVHAEHGGWVYTDLFILKQDGTTELYRVQDWDAEVLYHQGLAGVTCLHSVADWRAVGGFSEDSLREDWDFHLRLAARGICGVRLPLPLYTYRHATGLRRDAGTIRREVERVRTTWKLEDIVMPCKSCPNKRVVAALQSAPGSFVEVEYVGGNASDILVKGVSGKRYLFGNNAYHKTNLVDPRDVPALLSKPGVFRAAVKREQAPLAVQALPPLPEPPTAPIPPGIDPSEPLPPPVPEKPPLPPDGVAPEPPKPPKVEDPRVASVGKFAAKATKKPAKKPTKPPKPVKPAATKVVAKQP